MCIRDSIFPVTGSLFAAVGFLLLTFMTYDKPLWYMMLGMFIVGLGLGQLMQTLVPASQNAVPPGDMRVASSSATFFRQIGGTLGTAIMLSVLSVSYTHLDVYKRQAPTPCARCSRTGTTSTRSSVHA